jgi:serine/threonine-protein kinase
MGSVWRAKHDALGMEVAVKILSEELTDDEVCRKRFIREARSAGRIRSPHVVRTLDRGAAGDGTPYIVMELLKGESLIESLERRGVLPPREVAIIVAQVCKALSKAHEQDIVHRDIKPENIYLLADRDGVFVKVLDFGVAKMAQEQSADRLTALGSTIGTPYYMSVEQFTHPRDVGQEADLWALSVVCYEALTGDVAFVGQNVAQVMQQLLMNRFDLPSEKVLNLDHNVDRWFERAFAKDVRRRFRTAEELAESFVKVIAALPGELAPGETAEDLLRGGVHDIDDPESGEALRSRQSMDSFGDDPLELDWELPDESHQRATKKTKRRTPKGSRRRRGRSDDSTPAVPKDVAVEIDEASELEGLLDNLDHSLAEVSGPHAAMRPSGAGRVLSDDDADPFELDIDFDADAAADSAPNTGLFDAGLAQKEVGLGPAAAVIVAVLLLAAAAAAYFVAM